MRSAGPFDDHALLETLSFVRGRVEPPTADDVAAGLGQPRTVARSRLERLVAAGLVRPRFEKRTGRSGPGSGRPAKAYAAVPEANVDFPARRYADVVGLLIDALPQRGRGPRLREVGRRFGVDLARAARLRPTGDPRTALRRLCDALGAAGFPTSVETASETGVTLVTPSCPLRPLVTDEGVAHELDQGMWEALLDAALQPVQARVRRCVLGGCLSAGSPCRVTVELEPLG
jgi:predicted ArsR family transcriptional regulator